VAWRLVWGLVGSRYAGFSNFVQSPAAAIAYLRGYPPACRACRIWRQPTTWASNPAGCLGRAGVACKRGAGRCDRLQQTELRGRQC
jgi:cytochrome b